MENLKKCTNWLIFIFPKKRSEMIAVITYRFEKRQLFRKSPIFSVTVYRNPLWVGDCEIIFAIFRFIQDRPVSYISQVFLLHIDSEIVIKLHPLLKTFSIRANI